jgi:hypothetical protein
MAPSRTSRIHAASPRLEDGQVRVVVVLPTYRRPGPVVKTLASLDAQSMAAEMAVILVENHAPGLEGAHAGAPFFADGRLRGMVLVEEKQGNCFAYNAGFRQARETFPQAAFIAVIDDDEIAEPKWLATLMAAAIRHNADIVGGPQAPVFEDADGERRFGAHPVFQPAHHESGPVPLIHSTGNCFIGAHVIDAMGHPVLHEGFNFTGGGDIDFFTRAAARGFTFAWSNEARVHEIIPPRRTERGWITARSLRNGMLSALIQQRSQPGTAGRLAVFAKSLALLAAAPFRSIGLALRTGSFYAGSYHLMIAAGRIMAEFGYMQEQYRRPEKN